MYALELAGHPFHAVAHQEVFEPFEDAVEEVFFAFEVIVEGAFADTGGAGDLVHRGGVIAGLGETGGCLFQNSVPFGAAIDSASHVEEPL